MTSVVSVTVPHTTKVIKGEEYICTSGNKRGRIYKVIDFVLHDSSLQELVLFKSLSGNDTGKMYVCSFVKFADRYVLRDGT